MKILIAALALMLSACTIVYTPNNVYYTFGVGKIEQCQSIEVQDNKEVKKGCETLESKGFSAEFASIVGMLFQWWPF